MDKLDEQLFLFRIFLKKHDNVFLKAPDGKISSNITSTVSKIEDLTEDTNTMLKSLPPKVSNRLKHDFSAYKQIPSSNSTLFEHAEHNNIITNFHPINSAEYQDLKRLSIYNSEKKLMHTYVISESGKMLKKINQNYDTGLPPNFEFADEKEILEEKYQPSFEKYLTMHYNKVLEFNMFVKDFIENRTKNIATLELPNTNQNFIQNIIETIEDTNSKLKKLNPNFIAELKRNAKDLYAPAGRRGITFEGFLENSKVYLLPIKNNTHSNLIRLTISNKNGDDKIYLIKDNKFIVKCID